MSVDRRLVNLGIFLLILGAIPLATSQGWLERETAARAWELWPLVLVGVGIGLILRRTPIHFAGSLVVAATCGAMLGGLLGGGFNLGPLGRGSEGGTADSLALDQQGAFTGGTAHVTLRATCASLSLAPAPGDAWRVRVTGRAGARPILQQAADRLEVRSPDRTVVVPLADGQWSGWNVTLGSDAVYALDVNLSAGEANIDLGGLKVETLTLQGDAVGNTQLLLRDAAVGRLDVQVNAGDLKIGLPAGADLGGRIRANAASVALCADPETGLRLRSTLVVTGDNFASAGLVRTGNTWESPGTGSAAHVVDLALEGAAASFTLSSLEGCR